LRDGTQRASHDVDRWFGLAAQPMPLRKPGRIIVGKPGVARGVLPNQRFQRQVDTDGLNDCISGVPPLGLLKITISVGRSDDPTAVGWQNIQFMRPAPRRLFASPSF
jgi:hypothetical protein